MEADPSLRRIERTAVVVCLATVVAALVIGRGDIGPAVGVAGGGLLMAISYRTIASNVSGFVNLLAPPAGSSPAGTAGNGPGHGGNDGNDDGAPVRPRGNVAPLLALMLAKLVFRYALLALLAYVMIARLRLHPLGLLAGASSVPAAVTLEALRLQLKK